MRAWHDPLIAGFSLAVIIVLLVWCSQRPKRPGHGQIVQGVQTGLLTLYDRAKAEEAAEGQKNALSGDSLWGVFLAATSETPDKPILPPTIDSSDIFFGEGKASSGRPLCVVRVDNGDLFGITGNRQVRLVSPDEFEQWPHMAGNVIVPWRHTPAPDIVFLEWYLRIALCLCVASLVTVRYLNQRSIHWEPFGIPGDLVRRGLGAAMLFWPIVLVLLLYYWRKDGWRFVRKTSDIDAAHNNSTMAP